MGMAIGAAFVYPDMISAMGGETMYTLFSGSLFESSITMEFLGIPVILMNYTQSVIPVIVTNFFASVISRRLEKIIPKMVRKIFLPCITLAIGVPLGFLLIGPVVTWGCDAVGFAVT